MNKRLSSSLVGVVFVMLTGAAQAQCENMRVIVRNSVFPITGLEAFCTEFNKMKSDLAGMRSELSIAKQENAMLKARMTGTSVQAHDDTLARMNSPEKGSELDKLPR